MNEALVLRTTTRFKVLELRAPANTILQILSELSHERHPQSHTEAVTAPEEGERLAMMERGVSLAFLRTIRDALQALKRGDLDCGQLLNGRHTTSSATDWQEFDRAKDPYSLKACTLFTGTSFVETCIAAGLTASPSGEPFFGSINTFVSYTWRSDPSGPKTITFPNLVQAIEDTLADAASATGSGGGGGGGGSLVNPTAVFAFVDVFVCAQHRGERPGSGTCPNKIDVAKFEEVVDGCERLLIYCTPITQPKALSRVWCLFELMSAMKRGVPVLVALSAVDRRKLFQLLMTDMDRITTLFTDITSERAEATYESDRKMVFGWIRRDLGENGCRQLDEVVAGGMRGWLADTGHRLVKDIEQQIGTRGQGGSSDGGAANPDTLAVVMNQVAEMFHGLGRFGDAEELYRRTLALDEEFHGPAHEHTAETAQALGSLLAQQNQAAEAEALLRRALAANEGRFGGDHAKAAHSRLALAQLLQRTGQVGAAEELFRSALATFEGPAASTEKGAKEAQANCIFELATLLMETGRLGGSEALFRRSLDLREASLGPKHPRTASSLSSLGAALQAMGRFAEAEPIYRRALASKEACYGPEHVNTAGTLMNLGDMLSQASRLAEAEPLLRRSLGIMERGVGPAHPGTLKVVNNLAALLMTEAVTGANNRLEEAEALIRRCIEGREAALGSAHAETISSMTNLGNLLMMTGRMAEAESLLRRAKEICEASLGPTHPKTAQVLSSFGMMLFQMGRISEAKELLLRSVEADEAIFGADHPRVARTRQMVALFEREQEARKVETSEVEVPALGLPSAAAAHPPPPSASPVPIGTRVELHGLKAKPQLNGQYGIVVGYVAPSGRCTVALEGARGETEMQMSIKPENLTWK